MTKRNVEIQQAERDYDLNRAAELKYGKLTKLHRNWKQAEAELSKLKASGNSLLREEVTEGDIAEIISKWTGIPISKLVESERKTPAIGRELAQIVYRSR